MNGMKTWIFALVALIVGAAGSYAYMQPRIGGLADQVQTLQAQLAAADEKAQGATSEMETIKAGLEEKTKLIEEQQARIIELEAAAQNTTPQ